MPLVAVAFAVLAVGLFVLQSEPAATALDDLNAAGACPARTGASETLPLVWHAGPADEVEEIDRWCRGVGAPLHVSVAAPVGAPSFEDLVVLSWNAHLAEGELDRLIAALRSGALTDGKPVTRFVLLLQELYRRGPEVPVFTAEARSAYAIRARDSDAPDARAYAQSLGLSLLYVPSMRNGAALLEDRGNAIVSTEPLTNAFALELPFERQRRVAVGASIAVSTTSGAARLHLVTAHLEPLSSPSSLWVFRNPRPRQVASLLTLLNDPRFDIGTGSLGTVLGGDFNTIQGGVEEDAYVRARAWSRSLIDEDERSTHRMGRIDFLFFRLADGWTGATRRVEEKFGSDHHPVIGRFARE